MFGAKVKTPVASTLNGPFVTGVTSVFDAVTGTPFKVSFVVTFPTVVGTVVLGVCVGKVSATASSGLNTVTESVTVSQFGGATANPVVGLISQIVYVIG